MKGLTDSFDQPVKLSKREKKLLSLSINKIDFSSRIQSICWNGGIDTIADLVKYSSKDFSKLRNAGKKSGCEVEFFLKSNGLSWEMQI